jgi:hypothetical protein
MSSRQEEKEQRKQERLAREAAAASAAKRRRLVQLIGGVVVACAIVAGVAFAVSSGGGGGDAGGAEVDTKALQAAAKGADCVYRAFPNEGQTHEAKKFTAADYKTNPPTSGNHVPSGQEAKEGIYIPGNEPGIGNWVHTLEHGRVLFQYKPGIDASVVTQLDKLFNEDVADSGGGYHSVLMRNNSNMPFEVAAVAWRHYLGCEKFSSKAIDAMRLFREQLVDKAPEKIP